MSQSTINQQSLLALSLLIKIIHFTFADQSTLAASELTITNNTRVNSYIISDSFIYSWMFATHYLWILFKYVCFVFLLPSLKYKHSYFSCTLNIAWHISLCVNRTYNCFFLFCTHPCFCFPGDSFFQVQYLCKGTEV